MVPYARFHVLSIGLLACWPWPTVSFQVVAPTAVKHYPATLSVMSRHSSITQLPSFYHPLLRRPPQRGGPLFYRELKEDDDDATMLKVQTRTPIGFNMKEALQQKPPEQQEQQKQVTKNALNLPLIRALLINQVLILTLATIVFGAVLLFSEGFKAFSHLDEILHWNTAGTSGPALWDLQLTPLRLLEGIAGAIPLLVWGNWIESSDNRAFANVNFSTIVMTMTLFGRRKAPPDDFIPDKFKGQKVLTTPASDALFQSFVLSALTGVCEETVFRAELPAVLTHVLHFNIPLAIASQAFLFGLGHIQPNSSNRMENAILIGLQFVNGISLATLYVLSGGDIVPCIIAHALYDFVTFFKTWWDANAQLEYAEEMYLEPLPPNVESEVRRVLAANGNIKLDPLVFKMVKRLFFIFDFDKNKTLSKSEVRKGISYLALEKAGRPPPQAMVDDAFEQVVDTRDNSIVQERDRNRLSFSDFVRLYSLMYTVPSSRTAVQQ